MRIEKVSYPPSPTRLIERFAGRERPFVLDSGTASDGPADWSFFGADPFLILAGKDGFYREFSDTSSSAGSMESSDGLQRLREIHSRYCDISLEHDAIPFCGGAVGFLAYDYGKQIEQCPALSIDDRSIPDLYFGFYDGIAAFNHASGELFLIALGIRDTKSNVIAELRSIVCDEYLMATNAEAPQICSSWQWNLSPEVFKESVCRIRDFIASGDVYQVNFSRRARCRCSGQPVDFFLKLREGNPAHYGAFIDTGDLQIISTSPEQFLRKRGRTIETRPIKGTRPRGIDASEDQQNSDQLRLSEKDRAELLMIVDLERNDLGRVAEFGSVSVENLYQLEYYKSVIHQTAQVKATLREDADVFDAVKALFPGGSITGAPKIRAMELIEALEPTRRGVYCGSIGYIGFDGNAELNIAIRTLHLKGGSIDYQVGSGIVWDSDPEAEYQETLDKGQAIRETLDQL